MIEVIFSVIFWGTFWGLLGAVLGKGKNQMVSGIVWCFLLGPIGVLITLLLPDRTDRMNHNRWDLSAFDINATSQPPIKCSQCGARLNFNTSFCGGCGTEVDSNNVSPKTTGSLRLDRIPAPPKSK